MSSSQLPSYLTIVTLVAITFTGCRSARPPLPPAHVLSLYAPTAKSEAIAAAQPQFDDTAYASGGSSRSLNSTSGASSFSSGCCSH